ncbi:MAG: T9SS type A sorting domain-containing protein [Algicola sp.]|nr:T9SS type A sorting domain-containing protein [Algicola sp.]
MRKKYFNQRIFKVSFVVFLFFGIKPVLAQKPEAQRPFEISLEKDEQIVSVMKGNKRIDQNSGYPVAIYGMNYQAIDGTPEQAAMFYLQEQHKTLGLSKENLQQLQHHATRTSLSGSVVRYRQFIDGYPVNKAEVTISMSPENKVVMVLNTFKRIKHVNLQQSITADQAFTLAKTYLNVQSPILYEANNLVVYANNKMSRFAHEVVIMTNNPFGEWHVFVDAQTGEIFKVVDGRHYCRNNGGEHDEHCDHEPTAKQETMAVMNATGNGMVFNPDPLSSNQVSYGGGYVDGNDANTTELNNARIAVTLNDITLSAGQYSLVGPRAQIVDFDTPNTGLFTQASSDFSYTRQDQAFEAVNAYYHIDFLMNYINNTLGITLMPYQYTGGVKYDPHGAGGADNSYYTSGTGQLAFGEGCVDDAEDSDVIHHELGHGLHDWVTVGGLSQVEGLSEGSGDYVAQSYNRSLNNWQSSDPQYNWVFNWDGHNVCWGGRTTAHAATYPGGLVGQIHTDGQIWATCLMGIWDQIGQQEMDTIFYEGLGMTNGSSSQNDAANAVYQAAINLNYTEAQRAIIHTSLTACGYTLPALPGPPVAAFSADTPTLCIDTDNTVGFMDETIPDATSWTWTFEGGTPATSNDQNPTVTYSAAGTYDVTLQVSNSYGSDSMTITDYVTVLQGDDCPSCTTSANTTPVTISPVGAGNEYTSIINIPTTGEVTDVNVVNITGTHTWISDLTFSLISPLGTEVVLFSDICFNEDNFNVGFDDAASSSALPCPPTDGNLYLPESALTAFNGEDAQGDWTLKVVDAFNQDGGQLSSWSLEVCVAPELSVEEVEISNFSIWPNPNDGSFIIGLNNIKQNDVAVQVFDIRGRRIYNQVFSGGSEFSQEIDLEHAQSGMYVLKVSSGNSTITKKLIVK